MMLLHCTQNTTNNISTRTMYAFFCLKFPIACMVCFCKQYNYKHCYFNNDITYILGKRLRLMVHQELLDKLQVRNSKPCSNDLHHLHWIHCSHCWHLLLLLWLLWLSSKISTNIETRCIFFHISELGISASDGYFWINCIELLDLLVHDKKHLN